MITSEEIGLNLNPAGEAWLQDASRVAASALSVGPWSGEVATILADNIMGPVYAFAARSQKERPRFMKILEETHESAASRLPLMDLVFLEETNARTIEQWKGRAYKVLAGHGYDRPKVKAAVDEAFGNRVQTVAKSSLWFVAPPVQRNVMIATPAYGGLVHAEFTRSLIESMAMLRNFGVTGGWIHRSGDSLVPRSRIALFAAFLRTKQMTHLLFIDGDLRFPPESIASLIRWDKPIVGGVYPKKSNNISFPFNAKGKQSAIDEDTGCFVVKDLPTGFMMIRRDCAERMVEAYKDLRCRIWEGDIEDDRNQHCYNLFPTMVDDDGILLSEDYAFCRLWQRIGGEVWCDPHIDFGHWGSQEYAGRLGDHLQYKDA